MANKKSPTPAPYKRDAQGKKPPMFRTSQSKVIHITGDFQSLCGNIRLLNKDKPTRGTFSPIKVNSIPKTTPHCALCMDIWNNQINQRSKQS